MKARPRASRLASIGSLFKSAASEWLHDNVLRLSAAVSFYAVLSLAPLLAIIIRVMGIAHARQFAREQIIRQATYLMGTQAGDAIKPILENSANQTPGYLATIISTVVLLFSATSVFIELQNSMDSIWGVKPRPRRTNVAEHAVITFMRARLLSIAMVFGFGFLLVLAMLLSGFFTAVQQHAADARQWPAHLTALAISGIGEFALFCAIFKFLPDVRLRWRDVWEGALISAVLFSAGRFGLAIYFKYAHNNMYGAAGSLVAVLTWIYYSSFSLFYGAEFTKVWTRLYDPAHAPPGRSAAK